MERVGAALQRQVHRAGAGVADLRVVDGGLDLELLDRVGRRLDADARAASTTLLEPSMVNSLLIVPLTVRPRRLSLSIGRCSA